MPKDKGGVKGGGSKGTAKAKKKGAMASEKRVEEVRLAFGYVITGRTLRHWLALQLRRLQGEGDAEVKNVAEAHELEETIKLEQRNVRLYGFGFWHGIIMINLTCRQSWT